MAFLASPVAVSIGLVGSFFLLEISNLLTGLNLLVSGIIFFALPVILLVGMWVLYSKKVTLPEKASQIFLPFAIAFCYYVCVWIILFGVAQYNLDEKFFFPFSIFTAPYFVINLALSFINLRLFPLVSAAVTLITVLSLVITCKISKKNIIFDKRTIIIYCSVALLLSGIVSLQYYDRSTKVLFEDYQAEQIEDKVNLWEYVPFSADNRLKKLDEPATISFTEDYPILDGATAAYPVYGAIAQELYKGSDRKLIQQSVTCSNTREAYQRLINGEIDIFFGAQPSRQQTEAATEKGVELLLTPIAKEAFVFFVHKDNPVNNLTLEQIQDI
jgi:phosphate transport system substrate-binding protein